jgi:hypothetical protein
MIDLTDYDVMTGSELTAYSESHGDKVFVLADERYAIAKKTHQGRGCEAGRIFRMAYAILPSGLSEIGGVPV